MDCRVKTEQVGSEAGTLELVSILDLMDCRVKTVQLESADLAMVGFNP